MASYTYHAYTRCCVSRVGKSHRAHEMPLPSLRGARALTRPPGRCTANARPVASALAVSTRRRARGTPSPRAARRSPALQVAAALCGTQDVGGIAQTTRAVGRLRALTSQRTRRRPRRRARARAHERAELPRRRSSSAWLEASLSRGVAASEARPRGQCEPFSSHGRMRHAELIGCATPAVGDRVPRTRWRQLLCMSPARRPTWPADGSELGHD